MKLEDRCINIGNIKDKTDLFYYECNERCKGFNEACERYLPIKYAVEKKYLEERK